MKRFRILSVVIMGLGVGLGTGLGGCTSAMDYTSSVGNQDAYRLGGTITSRKESRRLIMKLNKMKRTHHVQALHEIEAR